MTYLVEKIKSNNKWTVTFELIHPPLVEVTPEMMPNIRSFETATQRESVSTGHKNLDSADKMDASAGEKLQKKMQGRPYVTSV